MDDALLESFERPLMALCAERSLREIEDGGDASATWSAIDALGFTDALMDEPDGGAGLSLRELFPLLFAAGMAGLGLPFGETAVARAMLAGAGHGSAHDRGPIVIAAGSEDAQGTLSCRDVPGARLARHVLVQCRGDWLLMPLAQAETRPGTWRPAVSASLTWRSAGLAACRFTMPVDAVALCNALHAAGMAGAMSRVLAYVTTYAQDRRQFGRPIGQFQAIQQDLAVLAEHAHSAALAARLGCSADGWQPDPLLAAMAKLRACEAARSVAAIAHAVFGAIGITEEHALGLYTRRLHEWRHTSGTEAECARQLGSMLLAQPEGLLDFVRQRLCAPASD